MLTDPTRCFELKGQVSKLTPKANTYTVGNGRTIVAGVAGKRIRVMGWVAISTTATAGIVTIKSQTAVNLIAIVGAPPSTGGIAEHGPIVESGYGETLTGDDLQCDVDVADLYLSVFYIVYTP